MCYKTNENVTTDILAAFSLDIQFILLIDWFSSSSYLHYAYMFLKIVCYL